MNFPFPIEIAREKQIFLTLPLNSPITPVRLTDTVIMSLIFGVVFLDEASTCQFLANILLSSRAVLQKATGNINLALYAVLNTRQMICHLALLN